MQAARRVGALAMTVPVAVAAYVTKPPSPFDEPALRRLEDNYARLHVADRPSLDGIVLALEGHQDGKWKVTKSKIPLRTNIALETPLTFRMWARDAPCGCKVCEDKTGTLTLVTTAPPSFLPEFFCDKHSPRGGGELWVQRKWNGAIELGEAGVDLVERPIPVLCNSLKQLYVVRKL